MSNIDNEADVVNLITGGSGFVARHLAQRLLQEGCRVRLLCRERKDRKLAKQASLDSLVAQGADVVYGDLNVPESLPAAIAGCARIFHLAAEPWASDAPRKTFMRVNVAGTSNLLEACRQAKVTRFVHGSTGGVYGTIRNPPMTEDSPLDGNSAYRESKILAELVMMDAYAENGFPYVAARISSVVGAGSTDWLGLVRAVGSGTFRIIGDGKNHDHVSHVSDIVEGLILCGEVSGIEGQSFLIGSKSAVTIDEIVSHIARDLGVPKPERHLPLWPYRAFGNVGEAVYRTTGYDIHLLKRYAIYLADKVLDISKAERELGFVPKMTIEDAISDAIRWYRSEGLI